MPLTKNYLKLWMMKSSQMSPMATCCTWLRRERQPQSCLRGPIEWHLPFTKSSTHLRPGSGRNRPKEPGNSLRHSSWPWTSAPWSLCRLECLKLKIYLTPFLIYLLFSFFPRYLIVFRGKVGCLKLFCWVMCCSCRRLNPATWWWTCSRLSKASVGPQNCSRTTDPKGPWSFKTQVESATVCPQF